jgi:hypothetical protein
VAYINLPPSLFGFFDKIDQRLLKLETANRFTAPVIPVLASAPPITGLTAGDPSDPRAGDIWLNSTTNTPKYVDATGAVTTLGGSGATTSSYYSEGADYTIPDDTTAYIPMTSGKQITITPGVYEFEGTFYVQAQWFTGPAFAASFQFNYATVTGTNAINTIRYEYNYASNTSSFATANTPTTLWKTNNTAAVLSAALSSGSRFITLKLRGQIRVSGTGTATFAPAGRHDTGGELGNSLTIQASSIFTITRLADYTVSNDVSAGAWA